MSDLVVILICISPVALVLGIGAYAGRRERQRWEADHAQDEVRRAVSKLMDEFKDDPETRDWLDRQLGLLDLKYDPHHWITMERIR